MSGTNRNRLLILFGVAVILLVAIFGRPAAKPATNTNVSDTSRATYAAAYDGLWRQDNGQSSVLVTATMFPPFLRSDLAVAANRTSQEDQIWSAMSTMPSTNVPIFLTFDSASGSLTDADISDSLELRMDNGTVLRFDHWAPLVGNTHLVNAPAGATSQIGVAVFSSNQAINWNSPPAFRLLVKKIAGVPQREFVWTSAALQTPPS